MLKKIFCFKNSYLYMQEKKMILCSIVVPEIGKDPMIKIHGFYHD